MGKKISELKPKDKLIKSDENGENNRIKKKYINDIRKSKAIYNERILQNVKNMI